MQLTELQTNLLEALRALTDWGRDNTSPRDANSPHNLLIRAVEVIAEADKMKAEDTLTYTLANGEKVVHHRISDEADTLARQPAGAGAIDASIARAEEPLSLYAVIHSHRYGTTAYLVRSTKQPTEEQVVEACDIQFEPEREEHIDIDLVSLRDARTVR